ncbi:hypothetical protein K505DRAFT_137674 [Melanomma pulvis-pyrius CBS 109.77]|uniref:Uncharacterized protein n=1 Tax=Melanomma pulvis-pyrius CBS 109.77 TaxID=1314802 RepID=A0A6A6WRW7_9PLEO|nr:hypothetical protein K505DRAFT_137674 [Melanomma pulvis-pyrius CBS 109.77]
MRMQLEHSEPPASDDHYAGFPSHFGPDWMPTTDPDTTAALWTLVRRFNSPDIEVRTCHIKFARGPSQNLRALLELGDEHKILEDWKNLYGFLKFDDGSEEQYKSAMTTQPTFFVHVHNMLAKILLDPQYPQGWTESVLPLRLLQPLEKWPGMEITTEKVETRSNTQPSHRNSRLPVAITTINPPTRHGQATRPGQPVRQGQSVRQRQPIRQGPPAQQGPSSRHGIPIRDTFPTGVGLSTGDVLFRCAYYLDRRTLIDRPQTRSIGFHSHVNWSSVNAVFPYLTIGFTTTQDYDTDTQDRMDAFRFGARALWSQLQLRRKAMKKRGEAVETLNQDDIGHFVCIVGMNGWALYRLTAGQPPDSTSESPRPWEVTCTTTYEMEEDATEGLVDNLRYVHYWGLQRFGKAVKRDLATLCGLMDESSNRGDNDDPLLENVWRE